jgi:DNA-binding transcriptional LysR family regulator
MELSWLEDFLELARTGNFSRAAELRHLTQPAFSRRIRALEDWAGVSMFDRSAQPVGLTEAGLRFQPMASMLVREIGQAREEARRAGAASAMTLRFAATHALSLIFFPDWIGQFDPKGARSVHLASEGLPACEALLQEGKVQFLLCHFHAAAPNRLPGGLFTSKRVGEDWLVPCAVPELARSWQDGATPPGPLPLLAYSGGSGLGRIFRAVLAPHLPALAAQPVMTADLAGLLKALCLEGRGIAWLPRGLVAAELADGRLLADFRPDWHIRLEIRLFRQIRQYSEAAEGFWRAVAEAEVVPF